MNSHPEMSQKVSVYESPDDVSGDYECGQLCAVRWMDERGQPRWYITVIVGKTETGYEVRWSDDIYRVDLERDEVLLRYNKNVMHFFQRHPDAISLTFGKDVYLFGNPNSHTIDGCLSAVNIIRERAGKLPISVAGANNTVPVSTLAQFTEHNKIVFL